MLSIYFIDFSINAGQRSTSIVLRCLLNALLSVMAVDRALMVDTLPAFEQPSGTAWAARMLAIGSVAGFFMCVSSIAILSNEPTDAPLF